MSDENKLKWKVSKGIDLEIKKLPEGVSEDNIDFEEV